jgi:hypothetical protein
MLSDYILTVAGARSRRNVYASHFKTPTYELNPLWQETIAKLRWFNGRHFVLTVVVSAIVIGCGESTVLPDDTWVAFFFGLLFGAEGMILGRHLGNLATFAYLRRHPEQISGEVTLTHELTLLVTLFQYTAVLVPLALLLIPSPTPGVAGALAGVTGVMLTHAIWLWRHRARQRRQKTTSEAVRRPAI